MKAVATLLRLFFCPNPVTRVMFALGLVCALAGAGVLHWLPTRSILTYTWPEWRYVELLALALPWLGLILLLASSAFIPAIVEKMLASRTIRTLPLGRTSLVIGTAIAASLFALLTTVSALLAFYRLVYLSMPESVAAIAPPLPRALFESGLLRTIAARTFWMAFVDVGLIYVAIWLVGKTSGLWRVVGTLWVIVGIVVPLRFLDGVPSVSWFEWLGVGVWFAFVVVALVGDRLWALLQSARARARSIHSPVRGLQRLRYGPGNEVSLLLGTTRPRVAAFGQLVPIALMTWLIPEDSRRYWLVILVVFSAMAGAVTSRAAGRSRRLWLHYDWTRPQIFSRAESTYWRYNAWLLAVLLATFVVLGVYESMPLEIIASGIVLLVLGCAVCTYLGFMVTREPGWLETVLCLVTMSALLAAGLTAVNGRMHYAVGLGALTAMLTVIFRLVAKSRWIRLDWMRSDRLSAV